MMVKHCLVTGASSQLGKPVLTQLVRDGFAVTAWSRDVSGQAVIPGVSWQQADLREPPTVASSVSLLIHLAPIDLLPEFLATRLPALRIIAISTCSIRFKAESACAQEREFAAQLLAAEQRTQLLAKEQGHQLTVLRPSMLYGAGRDGTVAVLQSFIQRFGFIVLPAQAAGLRQPVHVDDVAHAVLACLCQPATINKCYELGGAEQLTLEQMVRCVFIQNDRKPRVLAVPQWLLRGLIAIVRKTRLRADWHPGLVARAQQAQTVDNTAAQSDFSYAPRRFDGRFIVGADNGRN